jgi:hypothetical protein
VCYCYCIRYVRLVATSNNAMASSWPAVTAGRLPKRPGGRAADVMLEVVADGYKALGEGEGELRHYLGCSCCGSAGRRRDSPEPWRAMCWRSRRAWPAGHVTNRLEAVAVSPSVGRRFEHCLLPAVCCISRLSYLPCCIATSLRRYVAASTEHSNGWPPA